MYSKRRSNRAPGSVHWPCTIQLVLIMQNAEPQEAPASAAALIASAANSNRFMSLSPPKRHDARGGRGRSHSDFAYAIRPAGGARARLGGNCGEGFVPASELAMASATRGGRKETVQRTTRTGFAPASDSDKLSQVQTWPEPGGQTGDQSCRSTIEELPPQRGFEAL